MLSMSNVFASNIRLNAAYDSGIWRPPNQPENPLLNTKPLV